MSTALLVRSLACATIVLAGCIFPPKEGDGTGGGAGGGGAAKKGGGGGEGGADGDGGGASDAAAVGTSCVVPTTAGKELCESVSSCPGLTVSQANWKGCGFFTAGKSFTLACECSGYLCPASPTPTCAAAKQLLQVSNPNVVCGQLDNGGCSEEFLPPGTVADSG